MYYILNSSKGISSVFLGRLIGVKQCTAWKMGHAIRLMMDSWTKDLPLLNGTIEMDEKFLGGKPRYHFGVKYKVAKGTKKQSILVAIQRKGPVFPIPVDTVKKETVFPIVDAVADTSANLMTDKSYVFHYMNPQHLGRYLTELSFRWSNRDSKEVTTKLGKKKTIWKPKPIMEQLKSLLSFAYGTQLRWHKAGGL